MSQSNNWAQQGNRPPQGPSGPQQGHRPPQGQSMPHQGHRPPQGQSMPHQGHRPPQGQNMPHQGHRPPQGQMPQPGNRPPQGYGVPQQGNRAPQGHGMQGASPQAMPHAGANQMQQMQRIQQMQQMQQMQPMPDGVEVKPLDSGTMNFLQGKGIKLPQMQPVPTNPEGQQLPPTIPAELVQQKIKEFKSTSAEPSKNNYSPLLQELIQDEHNSSRFYAYLAEIASQDEYADYFQRESSSCSERVNGLSKIYQHGSSGAFEPVESEINTNVTFGKGVDWSIAVESSLLEKLGGLYQNAPDERSARKLFAHVCEKLTHILMLMLISMNKEIKV